MMEIARDCKMIVNVDFLNKLRDFGLNTYESKLWVALLSRGISTAGELSDIAGVPRSRTYDVLESLEKKGFIIMKLGKPIKYIAVQPSEVVERVQKRIADNAEKQSLMLENLKTGEILSELNALHTNGVDLIDPSSLSAALKGRTNIYYHLELMIKNAKKKLLIMTTQEGAVRKAKSLKKALKKAKEKGVKITIITPQKSQQNKDLLGLGEVKHTKKSPSRFCIVDDTELLFMVLDDKDVHPSYDLGIWVNSPYFVKSFSEMVNNTIN